jgi:sortase A
MKLFIGLFLVVISLFIIEQTFFPLIKNEVSYQLRQVKGAKSPELKPNYSEFGIVIDKLNINARIVKDVDPYNANIYQKALTQGVAHAKGTALPGEEGNIFIFSHSSDSFYNAVHYNSIFYLLPKLELGDTISIYYENSRFDYHVQEKHIVEPSDTKYLTEKTEKPQLTLMTCYPPGTAFKRFIIVAN